LSGEERPAPQSEAAPSDPLFAKGAWKHVLVTRQGPIVEVELHRPDARNALNATIMRELTEIARLLRRRADVLAVVLAGGETNFSAGADLSAIEARIRAPTVLETRETIMAGPDLCRAWEEVEAVTIAAIEGYCLGGACALVVACDFRIMGEGAYLRLPEVPLGINMSWNSVPRITTLAGPSRAKRFVIFGEAADARTCLAWGMADEVVAKGEARTVARAWAGKVCALPPVPVRMTKEAVNAQANLAHQATSFMDRDQYLLTTRSQDFREGVAAFFEKRKGTFRGD
jgi:enoyl-CoA hydratase/carnithine racemase